MAFIDELRERFGVRAPSSPTFSTDQFGGGLTDLIGQSLQIGQGQTFPSVPLVGPSGRTGLDQFIIGLSPEQDFLRGIFRGASLPGVRKAFGIDVLDAPQGLVEPDVPEREVPGDLLDVFQQGAGEFLPLILGSGAAVAGLAAPVSGFTALGGATTAEAIGVSAAGGLEGLGFLAIENILTGISADAVLDKPIAEGIIFSAVGSSAFSGLGAAFRATGQLPKFVAEQASDIQKNFRLRQLAQAGIDPRATDLTNEFMKAGRAIDEVTGGATNVESQANNVIFQTQNPRKNIQELLQSQKQFTDEVLDQRNLTEILTTRTNGDIAAKTTASADLTTLNQTTEALEALGMRPTTILDRVSPTASLSERMAVLNGNREVFVEVSQRMGIPEPELRKVLNFLDTNQTGPEDTARRMFTSLEEQAQTGMIQGRLDVVNPSFNGVDPVAKQFFELPAEARRDIVKVLQAFGMDTADPALGKSLVAFDRRVQDFFKPALPPVLPQTEDILRGVLRTAPSRAAAERALTPGREVGRFTTPEATGTLGLQTTQAGRVRRILANGIPLPTDPVEAKAVRQTLMDIADLYFQNKPHVALQAVHSLKNFDLAQKAFADTVADIGVELSKFDGPLGDFARNRFTLQGEFLGTRLLLSNSLDAMSAHYPELSARTASDIFGRDKVSRALAISAPEQSKFARTADTPARRARSFISVQRHEFGHEIHAAMRNSPNAADRELAQQIELAAHRQPYRNDDFSFREMTGRPMGPDNTWVKPHGTPINESIAELISNLTSPQGRAHIHPNARAILEGAGIRIQEAYKPNRPAFQFGPGDIPPSIDRATGRPRPAITGLSRDVVSDESPSFEAVGRAVAKLFPGKAPSAKVAGNAAVGPRGLGAQQEEVATNAIAALSQVVRTDLGPEKQIGLFTQVADDNLRLVKPPKAVQQKLNKQLELLGSDALQAFNESLITLPRTAQSKFVERFLKDGEKVLGSSITDYTKALREWRASAMLFGPSTWAVNILSTALNTAVRPFTALAASGIDVGRAAITGAERTRFATDALAEVAGLIQGGRDALHFIKADIQKLRGKQVGVPQNALQELFETGSVLRQGGFREAVFQGSDTAFLFSKTAATRGIAKPVGTGIQVPFNILRVSDTALYNMNFTGEMYRLAANELRRSGKAFSLAEVGKIVEGRARQSAVLRKKAGEFAETEMQKNFGEGYLRSDGSLPVPLKALQDDMIQKALLDTIPQTITEAKDIAQKTIFLARETGQFDKLLSKLDTLDEDYGGAISLALPFRRTPMNIIREGIRTSPLGFLAANETIGALVGTAPKTVEELTDAYAQAAVGTLLYTGMTALALFGVIEGNPEHFEQNRAIRTTMLADGRLPETVFLNLQGIGGPKLSVPLTRLQPIGGLVLGALRVSETIKDEGLKTIRPDILFGTQVDFIKSLGLQDQVEGTADLLESLVSDDPRKNFAERFGASFVPAFIRQGRQALGIEQGRSAKTTEANALTRFAQGLQAGAFNSGLPKLGLFGEALQRTPILGAGGIATIGRDPVVTAMIDAGAFHQAPDLLPGLREGTAQEKNSFIRGKGQLQKQFVTNAIKAIPGFPELSQERRKRIIDAAFTRASNIANRRGKNALRAGAVITPQLILSGKLGL